MTTTSSKVTKSESQALAFGKNFWIYSTSIESVDEEQAGKWKASLPEEYDHVDRIHRPSEFARALGLLVVEQLGRHCKRKVRRAEFSAGERELGRSELTPRGECGDAVEREMVP